MNRLKTKRGSLYRFVAIGLLLLLGLTGCHEFGMPDMGHHPMMPDNGDRNENRAGSFSLVLPAF